MATSRSWRQHAVEGPFRARLDEIAELNQVFSDSFTERYRRDGMVGVRVPFLNPTIWRYAIEDAADGAMSLARRARTRRRVQHGASLGRRRLDGTARRAHRVPGRRHGEGDRDARRRMAQGAGIDGHRARDDAAHDGQHRLLLATRISSGSADDHDDARGGVRRSSGALLSRLSPARARRRDRRVPRAGRSACCRATTTRARSCSPPTSRWATRCCCTTAIALVGFALAHTAPLVEGRAREELRVLKLVLGRIALRRSRSRRHRLCAPQRNAARRARMQGEYHARRISGSLRSADMCAGRICACRSPDARNAADERARVSNWEI